MDLVWLLILLIPALVVVLAVLAIVKRRKKGREAWTQPGAVDPTVGAPDDEPPAAG